MKMVENSDKLIGLSPEIDNWAGRHGFGLAGLWQCAFGNSEYRTVGADGHYGRLFCMPILLLGAAKAESKTPDVERIQRIFTFVAVPLDVGTIYFERQRPLEKDTLAIRGYVSASGLYQEWKLATDSTLPAIQMPYATIARSNINCPSAYLKVAKRFGSISAAWLADGRIFAKSQADVASVLNGGVGAAAMVHSGQWWSTLSPLR